MSFFDSLKNLNPNTKKSSAGAKRALSEAEAPADDESGDKAAGGDGEVAREARDDDDGEEEACEPAGVGVRKVDEGVDPRREADVA